MIRLQIDVRMPVPGHSLVQGLFVRVRPVAGTKAADMEHSALEASADLIYNLQYMVDTR